MKRTLTKMLLAMLALSMVFSTCGIVVSAIETTPDVAISVTEEVHEEGRYKLVFKVNPKEDLYLNTFLLAFSYDEADIQPVRNNPGKSSDGDDVDMSKYPARPVGAYQWYNEDEEEYDDMFSAPNGSPAYASKDGRGHVGYSYYTDKYDWDATEEAYLEEAVGQYIKAGEYATIFEFHYKYKDGATVDKDTFKFGEEGYISDISSVYPDINESGALGLNTAYWYAPNGTTSGAVAELKAFSYSNVDKLATEEPEQPKVDGVVVAENTATATVYYNDAVTGTVIIAAYDVNGTMLNCATSTASAATELTPAVTVADGSQIAKVKVFVWADYGTLNTAVTGAKVLTPAAN